MPRYSEKDDGSHFVAAEPTQAPILHHLLAGSALWIEKSAVRALAVTFEGGRYSQKNLRC